jgi:hypothetical protein
MRLTAVLWIGLTVVFATGAGASTESTPSSTEPMELSTPTVDAQSVEHFLTLAPTAWEIERLQMKKLEHVHRAHHRRRARRLEFQLYDLWKKLEYETGTSMDLFVQLRAAIVAAHRELHVVQSLRAEKADLLEHWNAHLHAKDAADEKFVGERERLDRELLAALARYTKYPEESRLAVEANVERIDRALRPPVKPSRAEQRERAERARELLPPPPENPYRYRSDEKEGGF